MATAFERLHPVIQRALWDLQWDSLRDLQVKAIHAWFERKNNLILMANTAAGKTEAAFLPVLSSLAEERGAGSVRALYIGPLKALINDQFRRVEQLCARAEIPVHRWHGDVNASHKKDVIASPSGVLLITPESLEALFIRRGREMRRIFAKLDAVVIDEMHVFLESERGRQLSSQLARLDVLREGLPRARRIGLSATIGGVEAAKNWISGGPQTDVEVVAVTSPQDVELLIKTFVQGVREKAVDRDGGDSSLVTVAEHIIENLHGATNLVFANRKADLEILADVLSRLCQKRGIQNQFRVHHGSLSKQLREEVEAELQSGRPCTALCSSTLELGIDIGRVDAIGQLYAPHSVSSLKQRLGRSGRRAGSPSTLWLYVPVVKSAAEDDLSERFYPELLQAVGMTELMLEKWVEPPFPVENDLSTLMQQILSLIAQHGGITAAEGYRILCQTAAFRSVIPEVFGQLLRDLGEADLIEQTSDGDLILGLEGERLVQNYEFYAAFFAAEEYSTFDGAQHIGNLSMPLSPYLPGDHILLAGIRWEIVAVDHQRLAVQVRRAQRKQPICWRGARGVVHGRVRQKMRELLARQDTPGWLNTTSAMVLQWARDAAQHAGVLDSCWVRESGDLWLFTWAGDRANNVLNLHLLAAGITHRKLDNGLGLHFPACDIARVRGTLESFVAHPPDAVKLVELTYEDAVPPSGKHSVFLSTGLRARAFASQELDVPAAVECARTLLTQSPQ